MGNKVDVKCVGSVMLRNDLVLDKALYVPYFRFNLISVYRLTTSMNCLVVFNTDGCLIQDPLMKSVWHLGKTNHGLYFVHNTECEGDIGNNGKKSMVPFNTGLNVHRIMTHNNESEAKLWHLRMGHMPFKHLKFLFSEHVHKSCDDTFLCTVCPMAKQTRSSFPTSTIKSVSPLFLLHVDIWGPYKHVGRLGHNMFISIMDDFSRHTWTYLIKHKNEFASILHDFVVFAERRINGKVKIIRSDNALEITEGLSLAFYKEHGIEQ